MHVVGVDFSEEVINANKSRYPDIDWLCLDAGTPGPRGDPGVTTGSPVWLTGIPVFFFFVSLLSTWRKLIVFLCFSHLFLTHLFVFSLVCNPPKPSKSPAPRVSTDIQESKRLSDVFLCSSVLDHHWPGAVQCCASCARPFSWPVTLKRTISMPSWERRWSIASWQGLAMSGPWKSSNLHEPPTFAWQAMLFPPRSLALIVVLKSLSMNSIAWHFKIVPLARCRMSRHRTDAAGSIRQLMQQCHAVLKDHGCVMLLDKADGWWLSLNLWNTKVPQTTLQNGKYCLVTVIVIVRYAFPIQTFINRGFSLAMCHYQRLKTWNDNLSVDFPAKYINWPEIGVYGLSRILRQIDKPFWSLWVYWLGVPWSANVPLCDPIWWKNNGEDIYCPWIVYSYDMTLVRLELERAVQIPKIIQSTIDSKPLGRFLWWWIHSAHHVVTNRVEVTVETVRDPEPGHQHRHWRPVRRVSLDVAKPDRSRLTCTSLEAQPTHVSGSKRPWDWSQFQFNRKYRK